MPAGLGHALELRQRGLRLPQPLQQVFAPHQVEVHILKRKREGVSGLIGEIVETFFPRTRTGEIEILLAQIDADDLYVRKYFGDQPRHRSGAAADVKDAMGARDRQMAQMPCDIGEPRLQLQSLALLVTVDHVRH